jgi:hypothetical protein
MRKAHCRTWNMERKLKNVEKETQTLSWNVVRNTKNVENEKYTL